jgi:hypothetical protein
MNEIELNFAHTISVPECQILHNVSIIVPVSVYKSYINRSYHYDMMCCAGLSIILLQYRRLKVGIDNFIQVVAMNIVHIS